MKVIITVGELLQRGKLEQAAELLPDLSFAPDDLMKEVELNEEQAGRLGLVLTASIGDFLPFGSTSQNL